MSEKRKKQAKQRFKVLPGEGRRFSFTHLKQALIYYVLLLLALVIVVQVGYHWLGDQFLTWRLQVVTAEEGIMEQEQEVSGLITRQEELIKAPDHGKIIELASPGERIPVDKELGTLGVLSRSEINALRNSDQENDEENDDESEQTNNQEVPAYVSNDQLNLENKKTIISETAGLLSNHLDGLEIYSGAYYMSEEEYLAQKPEAFTYQENSLVERGEPILKIVNNWQWYFNVIVPLHPGREIAEQEAVNIKFDFAPGEVVKADLAEHEIDQNKREVRLTYSIEKQIQDFEKVRWAEASLLYSRQRGIIIPEQAVIEKDSTTGVYLNQGGRVVFQPVYIVNNQDEKVMIEGLEPNSMVITRPDLVDEGQRLN